MKKLLLLVGVAACLSATPAYAYDISAATWDTAEFPIQYRINETSIPSSLGRDAGRNAVNNGFATWSAVSCTTFATSNVGTTSMTRGTAGDGENVILWISGGWPAELGDVNSVIGVTSPVWESGGHTIDADIQFNNVGFSWSTTGASDTVDAQSIATHEEGHFLGLDHSSSRSAVMYFQYSGGLTRTLTSDDQAGVCAIYPRDGVPPPAVEDPCASGSDSCGDCTPVDGCGWCQASSTCVTGTSGGPSEGTCASGWTWLPRDCAAPTGTIPFGGVCADSRECASGTCVGTATSSLCTHTCTTDCDCPSSYACFRASDGSRLCGPGTSSCEPTPEVDAGMVVDAGSDPAMDAGSMEDVDAGSSPDVDGGTPDSDAGAAGANHPRSGCSCEAAGTPATEGAPYIFAMMGALLLMLRRRRSI